MVNEKVSNRLVGIDLVKVIACFLVIVSHTSAIGFPVRFSSVMYYTGVMAIPLFFMTNGYLLLGKNGKDRWYSYKKIGRILLLTFIINVMLCILYVIIKHPFWNPISGVGINLFLQRGIFWHLWFLGALIIIYLFFPVLNFLYLHKQKYFFILSACLIFAQCFVDILNIYSSIKYNDIFQSHILQTYRLESHFSYFVLGGVIKLLKPKLIKYTKLRNVLLLYVLAIVYQFFIIKNVYHLSYFEFFYNNILIICLCVIFFLYISNIQSTKWEKEISFLASLIMVIYIIHPLVMMAYSKFINIVALDYLNIDIIRIIAIYIASILLSWIVLKIPYAKEIFKI